MDEKRLPNEQEGLKKDQGMGQQPKKDIGQEKQGQQGQEKSGQEKSGQDVKR